LESLANPFKICKIVDESFLNTVSKKFFLYKFIQKTNKRKMDKSIEVLIHHYFPNHSYGNKFIHSIVKLNTHALRNILKLINMKNSRRSEEWNSKVRKCNKKNSHKQKNFRKIFFERSPVQNWAKNWIIFRPSRIFLVCELT